MPASTIQAMLPVGHFLGSRGRYSSRPGLHEGASARRGSVWVSRSSRLHKSGEARRSTRYLQARWVRDGPASRRPGRRRGPARTLYALKQLCGAHRFRVLGQPAKLPNRRFHVTAPAADAGGRCGVTRSARVRSASTADVPTCVKRLDACRLGEGNDSVPDGSAKPPLRAAPCDDAFSLFNPSRWRRW